MPWIPIVPKEVKRSDSSDPRIKEIPDQVKAFPHDPEDDSNIKGDIVSRQSAPKKFSVTIRQSKTSEENRGDLDEPQMTSSTFKSMSGVKVVALQNPQRVQVPAEVFSDLRQDVVRPQRFTHLKHGDSHRLCFDLDSDSDTPSSSDKSSSGDFNQRVESATRETSASSADRQIQPAVHEAGQILAHSPRTDSGSTTRCGMKRKLLGRLAVEVVGLSFYKAAASQHRLEGDPVYLVREPGNKYDAHAMRVMLQEGSGHIGHIPRSMAQSGWAGRWFAEKASLTTSFSGGKLKIPKTLPIVIQVFEETCIVPENLKGFMESLMAAITLPDPESDSKRGKTQNSGSIANQEPNSDQVHKIQQSFQAPAFTAKVSVSSELLGGKGSSAAGSAKHEIQSKIIFQPLPLPMPFVSHPQALDVTGLLSKAAMKSIEKSIKQISEQNSFDSCENLCNDHSAQKIEQCLDERIEDAQALFDVEMLDSKAKELASHSKRFQCFALESRLNWKKSLLEQQVQQDNRNERANRSTGMCTVDLEYFRKSGVEMSAEEAVDHNFLLPLIDSCVLSNLK